MKGLTEVDPYRLRGLNDLLKDPHAKIILLDLSDSLKRYIGAPLRPETESMIKTDCQGCTKRLVQSGCMLDKYEVTPIFRGPDVEIVLTENCGVCKGVLGE